MKRYSKVPLHESNKKKKNGGEEKKENMRMEIHKKTQLVVVALLLSVDSTSGVPVEIDVSFARSGPRPVLAHADGREVHLIPFFAVEVVTQSAFEHVFYVLFMFAVKVVAVAGFSVRRGSSRVELDVKDGVS